MTLSQSVFLREPVIVDTGAPMHRELWLEKVFSLVEPEDVRWIFLSHDDGDHTGGLLDALELCQNATFVTNFFSVERLALEKPPLPLERMRWIEPGGSFDAGDRTLRLFRPPIFRRADDAWDLRPDHRGDVDSTGCGRLRASRKSSGPARSCSTSSSAGYWQANGVTVEAVVHDSGVRLRTGMAVLVVVASTAIPVVVSAADMGSPGHSAGQGPRPEPDASC